LCYWVDAPGPAAIPRLKGAASKKFCFSEGMEEVLFDVSHQSEKMKELR
jgi:hypothetical protein